MSSIDYNSEINIENLHNLREKYLYRKNSAVEQNIYNTWQINTLKSNLELARKIDRAITEIDVKDDLRVVLSTIENNIEVYNYIIYLLTVKPDGTDYVEYNYLNSLYLTFNRFDWSLKFKQKIIKEPNFNWFGLVKPKIEFVNLRPYSFQGSESKIESNEPAQHTVTNNISTTTHPSSLPKLGGHSVDTTIFGGCDAQICTAYIVCIVLFVIILIVFMVRSSRPSNVNSANSCSTGLYSTLLHVPNTYV